MPKHSSKQDHDANLNRHLRHQAEQRGHTKRNQGKWRSRIATTLLLVLIAIYLGLVFRISLDPSISFLEALIMPFGLVMSSVVILALLLWVLWVLVFSGRR